MTPTLFRAGAFLKNLSGWRRLGAALGAGSVSALGFAPFNMFPLLLLAFAVLVLLLDGVSVEKNRMRKSAATGWAFGFGQFLVGMHWIFYPFLVDPLQHAWQIPLVVLLFPGGLALFSTIACAASMLVWKDGPARIFIFSIFYAVAEWLRGHVLTGLPWNLPAYAWGASLSVLQSTALIGAYGLTFLTTLFGASLGELLIGPRRWFLPAIMTVLFVMISIAGEVRLYSSPTIYVPAVRLRVVQPNIPQDEKYRRELLQRNWDRLVDLSTKPAGVSPTVIIWPEAAPPVLLQRSQGALEQIAVLTGPNRVLITGNQRMSVSNAGDRLFYNSLYIFGHGGQLLSTYDKFHLVPFGEYLPIEEILRKIGITRLVGFPGSFAAGDGPHTYKVPGAPDVGPLICYEILFPGAVVGEERPDWLVNVTDDSWFGPWAGPRQHLLAARVRAIEEGLPVVRSANTGVSAVIDPLGRTIAELGLGETGELDSALPRAVAMPAYARYGDACFVVLLLIGAGLSSWLARKLRSSLRSL